MNKGTGGADPFLIFEVRDPDGHTLVGGPREMNCEACKTKPLKRCLEGYPSGHFTFKVDSFQIRSGCELLVTVLDFKPAPLSSRAIGNARISLKELTSENGAKRELALSFKVSGPMGVVLL